MAAKMVVLVIDKTDNFNLVELMVINLTQSIPVRDTLGVSVQSI